MPEASLLPNTPEEEKLYYRVAQQLGKYISWKLIAATTCAALGIAILAVGNEIYRPHPSDKKPIPITITSGLGSRKIAILLKRAGVIRSKWAFVTYVSLRGEASELKPGHYTFTNATVPEISRVLIEGKGGEYSITIPEGWSVKDIGLYLERQHIGRAQDFWKLAQERNSDNLARQFAFLSDKPATQSLEGYLFPDTYRIVPGTTLHDIINEMLENFDRKITPGLRTAIRQQEKTVFEIITMASLIEKEVISEQDRAIVSGILWKRLDQNLPLQVDATLVHIKQRSSPFQERIATPLTVKDKELDSPYNTYRYKGLPTGPIANPGISAIRAALYPQETLYFYYLSAPDGRTIFSRTLEEHNRAKARYLK